MQTNRQAVPAFYLWVVIFVMWMVFGFCFEAQGQTASLKYGVEYKCGERLTVYYCRSDDQSRDAYPVQPLDDYCKVEYPDRPSNPGYVYEGSELRGDIIKKLQACGVLQAAQPKTTSPVPPSNSVSAASKPTPAAQAAQTQSASSYLAEGQKYRQAKDDAKALQSFQMALKAGGSPATMALVNLEIGKVYAEQNQDVKALPWLREASRLDPNLANARAYLGVSYYVLGKYPEALKELQEAVRLRPNDYITYDWLAATYEAQGKKDEAIAAWKHALATKPQDAGFLVRTGNELNKRKEYDAALGAFLSAVQLKPEAKVMALAQYGIGNAYNSKDNMQAAIAPVREAIRLKPDYTDAHSLLAAVYYRLKKYPESIAEYKIAIALNPNDGWKYYTLGLSYKEAGRKDLAAATWKQILTLKEKDKDMLSLTGSELYEIQEYDLALATYRSALTASQPEDANDNDGFGTALLNAGVFEGMAKVYFARKQYGEIVKLAESLPENASFFPHELGNAYVAINQFAKAVKVFEEAATDDAQNIAESLYDLGHCYNLMGRKPDARRIYAKLRGIEQEMALKLLGEINQTK